MNVTNLGKENMYVKKSKLNFLHSFWSVVSFGGVWRITIIAIYTFILHAYFFGSLGIDADFNVFVGMIRRPLFDNQPTFPVNIVPFSYIIAGIALTLEQPSRFLLKQNSVEYVRQRRGVAHYMRYLGTIIAYGVAVSSLQVFLSLTISDVTDVCGLIVGAYAATWTLIVYLLLMNVTIMINQRYIGYALVFFAHSVVCGASAVQHYLLSNISILGAAFPVWSIVLAILSVGLILINYAVLQNIDIM